MKNIFKIVLYSALLIFSLCGCINVGRNTTDNKVNKTPTVETSEITETPEQGKSELPGEDPCSEPVDANRIIVLDPGHGKSSALMSEQEKMDNGYTYIEGKGWGEWRHFKSGTMWQECEGRGCSGRAPQNGGCWYSIGSGDRDTEPDINYNNAINAKKHLESMGYTVRLTRGENESPAITQRIKKCYPNSDISAKPDALAYVCIHSNAGGGRGTCYISLSGIYDQSGIQVDYVDAGNGLGKSINDHIVESTSLSAWGTGEYTGYPELILFCKSPVPVAYMEIGFYDNPSDLNILRRESDGIGKAIAEGINEFFKE